MCELCELNKKLYKADGTEFWIEYEEGGVKDVFVPVFVLVTNRKGDQTNFLRVRYCPLCGRNLPNQRAVEE